jgi:hypothetical protein
MYSDYSLRWLVADWHIHPLLYTGVRIFGGLSPPVLRIRIRIHMFLGLPDPDPLVRGMDPDPDSALDPDPSIIMKKKQEKP